MAEVAEGHPAVVGIGGALGDRRLTNDEFVAEYGVELPENWRIEDRAGIHARHFTSEGQFASDMGIAAARMALDMAGVKPTEHGLPIDAIFLSTSTPDQFSPSTAVFVNQGLGVDRAGPTVDHNAACAGFVYGMFGAVNALSREPDVYHRALVLGAEMPSAGINPKDHKTAGLFGAGSGAVILERRPDAIEPQFAFWADPDPEAIQVKAGLRFPPKSLDDLTITMEGLRVGQHAAEKMGKLTYQVADMADRYNPRTQKIDWDELYFAPHPGNGILNQMLANVLEVPKGHLITSVADHGNTSSASIPLALHQAREKGMIRDGESYTVLSPAIGAGMVAGAGIYTVEVGPGDPAVEAEAAEARQSRRARLDGYPDTLGGVREEYAAHLDKMKVSYAAQE
ncbi:MAG TPA: ketoacyl-ACP synthase III [Verrucomicrobiae bacterium]|nr:ketoacyl-ACP synthase III [Verrucomicrobiae bacterium]